MVSLSSAVRVLTFFLPLSVIVSADVKTLGKILANKKTHLLDLRTTKRTTKNVSDAAEGKVDNVPQRARHWIGPQETISAVSGEGGQQRSAKIRRRTYL